MVTGTDMNQYGNLYLQSVADNAEPLALESLAGYTPERLLERCFTGHTDP